MKIKFTFKNLSSLISHFSFQKGFTLIELLIVIAILGVLAGGILVAIDPVDKINAANDSKVQNDVSAIGRSAEAYAIVHGGFYPNELDDLVTSGELKRKPVPPNVTDYGTAYVVQNMKADLQGAPAAIALSDTCVDGATANPTCIGIIITGRLKSKKYTSVVTTPFWAYESPTGKSCLAGAASTTVGNSSICL